MPSGLQALGLQFVNCFNSLKTSTKIGRPTKQAGQAGSTAAQETGLLAELAKQAGRQPEAVHQVLCAIHIHPGHQ